MAPNFTPPASGYTMPSDSHQIYNAELFPPNQPGWQNSNPSSTRPQFPSHDTNLGQTTTGASYGHSAGVHYPPTDPETQMYPMSSSRTMMDDARGYDGTTRPNRPFTRPSSTTINNADLPKISMDSRPLGRLVMGTLDAGHHARMTQSHILRPPMSNQYEYYNRPPSRRHSTQELSVPSTDIRNIAPLPSPSSTYSSSASGSPMSPYPHHSVRNSDLHGMRIRSPSAENDSSPYSYADNNWGSTATRDVETGPSGPYTPSPIDGPPTEWCHNPAQGPGGAVYNNPSRSGSSPSNASHSASESDSSPTFSSIPHGVASHRRASTSTSSKKTAGGPARKNKMHTCTICEKRFPRPSGLATHMNSHTGEKPFECPAAGCDKTFAVRSNAKRHLRTHGPMPLAESPPPPPAFEVDFEAPVVAHNQNADGVHHQLRWVQPGPTTRADRDWTGSGSGSPSGSDAPSPLSGVYPSGPSSDSGTGYANPYPQWR